MKKILFVTVALFLVAVSVGFSFKAKALRSATPVVNTPVVMETAEVESLKKDKTIAKAETGPITIRTQFSFSVSTNLPTGSSSEE